MLFCGFHVGMRRMEIVEARPEWFNLRARTLEIRASDTFRPKDRDARTVPLTDQFVEFLGRYGLRSPFVLKPEVGHGSFGYRYDSRRPFMLYMKAQGGEWLTPDVRPHALCAEGTLYAKWRIRFPTISLALCLSTRRKRKFSPRNGNVIGQGRCAYFPAGRRWG